MSKAKKKPQGEPCPECGKPGHRTCDRSVRQCEICGSDYTGSRVWGPYCSGVCAEKAPTVQEPEPEGDADYEETVKNEYLNIVSAGLRA